jgi:hypothetical protein
MKNKNIARMYLPKDIKPCPFCGSKSLRAWKKYEVKSETKTENITKDYSGRVVSITCGGCGIGVDFGWYGNGINDADMRRNMIKEWNRRIR